MFSVLSVFFEREREREREREKKREGRFFEYDKGCAKFESSLW